MLEGNDTAGVGRIEARHRAEAEFGNATMNHPDEWIRVAGNFRHTDGVNVLAGCVQGVNGGEIGHPDGEAGGAWFGLDALEPIRLERVGEMKPSTGTGGEPRGGAFANADDASTVEAEEPFVRTGDDTICIRTIEDDAANGLGDID